MSAGCDDFTRKPFKDAEIFNVIRRHLGVRFVYADTEEEALMEKGAETTMANETLLELPPVLSAALKQAAIDGDSEKLRQTIAAIQTHDGRLAEELTRLTDDFEFDTILDVIQAFLKD